MSQSTSSTVLTTRQAAAYLGVSKVTLERWRMQGIGPRYVKHGRYVRYRLHDLERFFEENVVAFDALEGGSRTGEVRHGG